jgi:serine/threonine protein kinase
MMNPEIAENCAKCGKNKRSQSAGSLTQWLFSPNACDCDFLKLAAEAEHSESDVAEKFCSTCGKRVSERRKGSLTHWVFRAEQCVCNQQTLTAADFSPSRLPQPSEVARAKQKRYVRNDELTAELGLSDRFAAIELLGKGSSARVYRCWDLNLNKEVAVKLLSGLQDKEVISFQDEARSTSTLSHSSIVRILDFGLNSNDKPYMVMEFIDGKSLELLVQEHGPMPFGALALIMISICSGMHHAHQAGIFHRDLKSSNIMIPLTVSGVPIGKVIDFGVAALNRSDSQAIIYQGHQIAGTPRFMSPDQLRGETYDARSDIYSLGCTMFQALTGQFPFDAETHLEILNLHANHVPPLLADANPDLEFPQTLENIIAKTLAKKKEDRFQSMLELRTALEECLEEQGSDPKETIEEESSSSSRSPLKLIAIVCGALACLAVAAFGFTHIAGTSEPLKSASDMKKPIPHAMDEFTSGVFHLDSVTMSDDKLQELPENTTDLDLVASDVTDRGMQYLIGLPLHTLRLDASKITDAGLEQVSKIPSLRVLYVGDNPNITRDGVKHLEKLRNLEFLSLNGSALTDEDLACVGNMKSLKRVSLGAMKNLTGTGLGYLTQLPQLVSLRLSGVDLNNAGKKQLAKLTTILDLEARTAHVDKDFMDAVLSMKNLEALNLSESTINDKQLLMLAQLKKLKIIRVEKCRGLTDAAVSILASKLPQCNVSDGRRSAF